MNRFERWIADRFGDYLRAKHGDMFVFQDDPGAPESVRLNRLSSAAWGVAKRADEYRKDGMLPMPVRDDCARLMSMADTIASRASFLAAHYERLEKATAK